MIRTHPLHGLGHSLGHPYHGRSGGGRKPAFIVAGQSNATAYVPFDDGTDYPADGSILQVGRSAAPLTSNADGAIINAARPLDHHTQNEAGGMGFALQFALDYIAANPSKPVLLIPAAAGSTGFSNNRWNEGDDLFEDMVTRTNTILADNPDIELRGILWHQGEADTDNSTEADAYESAFDAFVYAVRNRITGARNIPLVVGQLVPDFVAIDPLHAQVDGIILDTPNRHSFTAVAVNTDLTDAGDNVHFSAAAFRTLGTRYYNALATAQANIGTAPGQVTGLNASAGDTQNALSWSVPASAGTAQITDYQIEVSEAGGPFSVIAKSASAGTTYTHTGLTNGVEYTYRVSARNVAGLGDTSATSSATPAEGAGSTANPADYTPEIWFSPRDAANRTLDGSNVATLTNKGSLSIVLGNTNTSQYPELVSVGGVEMLSFAAPELLFAEDGSGELGTDISGDYTLILVFDVTATGAQGLICKQNEWGPRIGFDNLLRAETSTTVSTINGSIPSGLHILIYRVTGGTGTFYLRGATTATSAISDTGAASGSSDLVLGARTTGNSPMTGNLGEVFLKNTAMSNADINTLCSEYFANDYSIAWADIS